MPATDAEYLEISEAYEGVKRELEDLFKVGTDKARVNDLLRQATRDLERGDYDRARLNISKAQSTARTSTQNFITNLIVEYRNILLAVRTKGADISTARPMLITAKKALDQKRYRRAAVLCLDSIETIGGLDDDLMSTLKVLAKVRYNYTLVESFGLDMSSAEEPLVQAFNELKAGNYRKALDLAARARAEVKALNTDYRETLRLLTDARFAVDDARRAGEDVTQQEFLFNKGVEQFERNEFEVAKELLRDAISIASRADQAAGESDDLASYVSKRKRTAKEAIARTKGMGADVSDAEIQYAAGWKRQQEGDLEEAIRFYSRAIDKAIDAGKAMAWKGD